MNLNKVLIVLMLCFLRVNTEECSEKLTCGECTQDKWCVWCNATEDVYACHDGGLAGANDVCQVYYWWQCSVPSNSLGAEYSYWMIISFIVIVGIVLLSSFAVCLVHYQKNKKWRREDKKLQEVLQQKEATKENSLHHITKLNECAKEMSRGQRVDPDVAVMEIMEIAEEIDKKIKLQKEEMEMEKMRKTKEEQEDIHIESREASELLKKLEWRETGFFGSEREVSDYPNVQEETNKLDCHDSGFSRPPHLGRAELEKEREDLGMQKQDSGDLNWHVTGFFETEQGDEDLTHGDEEIPYEELRSFEREEDV